MNNNDKFIRDTEFGKLMENQDTSLACPKCKYSEFHNCEILTDKICYPDAEYYFAKDETDENKNLQNLQK